MAFAFATPVHKNPHVQGATAIIALIAGFVTVYYMLHQTKLLKLQIAKHADETKLLMLQIQKHETDLPADTSSEQPTHHSFLPSSEGRHGWQ